MKFAIIAALFAVSSVSADTCPEKVVVGAFGTDNTCDDANKDADKTKTLQENWDFLAKTFPEECYKVGTKYIKWTCTEESIKAEVFKDDACTEQDMVATDHPVEKEFKWDACTKYSDEFIKVSKP